MIPRSQAIYASLKRGVTRFQGDAPGDLWASPVDVVSPWCLWELDTAQAARKDADRARGTGREPDETRPGPLLLGSFDNRLLGVNRGFKAADGSVDFPHDDRHMMTIAGTRGGKTSRVILPNLYTYPGSVIAIDPKGELATKSAQHRAEVLGQKVFVLDPYGAATGCGLNAASWNPLAEIDPKSDEALDDARKLAEAMTISSGRDSDAHWIENAQNVIAAVILYVLNIPTTHDAPPRNLLTVRDMLMLNTQEIKDTAKRDPKDPGSAAARQRAFYSLLQGADVDEDGQPLYDGFIAAMGATLESMADKERESVFSTARTQTRFLDSRKMRGALSGEPFKLADLKRESISLYLCLPARYMHEQRRWMRLIINLALAAFERDPTVPRWPILFLLEEFPQLGVMQEMKIAAALLAGYGIRLWFIIQDTSQLEDLYGKTGWETFFANCGTIQAFNLNSMATLQYLSQRIGSTTFWQASKGERSLDQRRAGATGESQALHTQPLATERELADLITRTTGNQLILTSDGPPRIVHLLQHATVAKIKAGTLPEVAGLRGRPTT